MGCGSFKSGQKTCTGVYEPLDSNSYPEAAVFFALLQPPPSPASVQGLRFPGQLGSITEESERQWTHSAIPTA